MELYIYGNLSPVISLREKRLKLIYYFIIKTRIFIVNIPMCIFFIILIHLKMSEKSDTKILLYIKSQVKLNKRVKELLLILKIPTNKM